jgi:Mrp family chromosome partitioning ATPase/capsular polysaccharide biosynthesis protein
VTEVRGLTLTDQSESSRGLRHYVEVLWRRKWLVIGALIIIPAIVLVFSLQQPTEYSATARVMALSQSPSISVAVGANVDLSRPDERELQTLASFVVTREIAGRAAEQLGWSVRPATVMDAVTAEADPSANVINVTAVWGDAQGAADLANAFATEFILWRQETLQKSLDSAIKQIDEQIELTDPDSVERTTLTERRGQLEVLKPLVSGGLTMGEAAQPPDAPSSPKPLRDAALAFAAALVFGVGLAFLRDSLDVRLHSAGEIAEHTSLPILAEIPELGRHGRRAGKLVVLDDPRGPGAESYRFLRTNLEFINFNRDAKVVLVSSPLPGQGKSTTIANLAIALLRADKRVAIVDADLRRPSLHRFFQTANLRGVSDVVSGASSLADATQSLAFDSSAAASAPGSSPVSVRITTLARAAPTLGAGRKPGGTGGGRGGADRSGLLLLPSGPIPPNPGEIVGSQQFGDILRELGKEADYVLVDAPPMFAVGDAGAMAPWVDGLLVVLRLEQTTADTIAHVEEFFTRTHTRPLGIIVTGVRRTDKGAYYTERYYT